MATATFTLAPDPRSSASARDALRGIMGAWADEEIRADAALLLTELVANVVRHARSPMAVRLTLEHDVLRAEGCAHPIDYHTTDYAAEVRRLTGGEGVDIVLDPLGGNDWRKGLKLLRPVGRLVAYGFANLSDGRRRPARLASQVAGIPLLTPLQLMNNNRTVSGVNIGRMWGQIAILREELQAVLTLWDEGKIKPRVDMSYPFTQAADAHRRILQRQNIGKVLLKP